MFKGPAKIEMVTTKVAKGTLVQTVEATGELESIDKVDLSFGASGTLENLLVEVGDDVVAGQILATLDLTKLSASAESAQRAVEIAQANLALKKAGSSDEAIGIYEAQVASAQAALAAAEVAWNNAEITGQAAVAEAGILLINAKEDLENTQIDNDEDLTETYDDLIQVLKNNMIVGRAALSDADEVLGIDNSMANDDFEEILSVNNYQALVSANNAFDEAKTSRDQAEDVVFSLSSESETTTLETAVDLVEIALADLADTLLYTRRALDATNINNADFSSDDLSTLKASIDTARNNVQTEEEALTGQLQTIAQLKITNAAGLDSAENLVDKYEKTLASAEASYETSVATAKATVAVRQADLFTAQANLSQAEAAPRVVDLSALEAAVSQAQANYVQAQANLSDAQIIAPIDGRVTAVEVERGEEVSSLASVITVQTTSTKFQIVVDVSESDISKISIDDSATITFDAFGDDREFTGRVGKIDPAEKNLGGVIYYEVTVYPDDLTESPDWKPGMTSDVTFLTENLERVVLITQRAVLEKPDGTKYVRLPRGESFEERIVEVGLRGDGGLWQVLSGLTDGETVIVTIRE